MIEISDPKFKTSIAKSSLGSRHVGWTVEKFEDPNSEIFPGDFFSTNECL